MSLNPTRARELSNTVSCRLDNVVTLQHTEIVDFVIWDTGTKCCGLKGIFPVWAREASTCSGPKECALLEAGELFYPPDISIWELFEKSADWEKAKASFVLQEDCACILPDEMMAHIEEMQQKWGISTDA